MPMTTKYRVLATCLLAAMVTGSVTAQASDQEHIFCMTQELLGDTVYYSAIFLGDYSNKISFKNDFDEYLESQGYKPGASNSYCFFEQDYPTAERAYESHVRMDDDLHDIVRTNWAPDSFTNQPLQDFNVTVSSSDQEVRVCVRDHECEDGDRVRVSVNGGNVFSGEIDNDWACDVVPVREGKNRVELFASNGTGRKGNCSYADVNTGEIHVEGKNGETQSWRHRGGAGSSASIIVNVE